MRAWLLTFVPESSFRIQSGQNNVTTYTFNKNQINHIFCKTCGTASYGTGSDGAGNIMVAINVRCLDEVDLSSLTITQFDGKSI